MPYPTRPVTLAVVGAGNRGQAYADWTLQHPEAARVVAVAEPDPARRERFAASHGLGPDATAADWRELFDRPRVADAVIIATQDRLHTEPAVAFARAGYDVLLEKPLAPTLDECEQVAEAARAGGGIVAACHVLLYTPHTAALREVLASGRIGEIASIQHLEPVGYWHQAHSFVRGNWRRRDESAFMLLAKSCHDIDWLQHIVGRPIRRVSSFGGRFHFGPEHAPVGAAERCVDCRLQDSCEYSAVHIYGDRLSAGDDGWPVSVVVDPATPASLAEALRTGPYGRCVYHCDNDVVDHQVVSLEFDGGASGVFTMTGFTEYAYRQTRIFGTHGELTTDGRFIDIVEFAGDRRERIDVEAVGDATAGGGHGGGDEGLMAAFSHAVATRDTSGLYSGIEASLASHRAVFAAERARLESAVIGL
ncbi:MAG: Gfo/Idh/MocA family oxidoreductase [Propionicimonas sp.]|uniref:Gfo/Idh/MocA family protein n=1 Tax=Propionicimonas sp. TaxID=1955623 RepID=UPI002B205149|nr:Gfo/Idh/MocA family oxidoreductase [Propionicimonas sp.]MEA4945048.1 Gfo/Idh/MocA family oxidoreductase [Propionicimonas sp.]